MTLSWPASLRRGRRETVVLILFVLWAVVLVTRLAQVMILQRPAVLQKMSRESWIQGVIPPLRGRLLDRNGIPLAWSTRHFALRWDVPADLDQLRKDWQVIRQHSPALDSDWDVPRLIAHAGSTTDLAKDLGAERILHVEPLCERVPGLTIGSYFVRHYHRNPHVRKRLGKVRTVKGIQVGISGDERRHDTLLRGCPGVYRVMVDPDGNWLNHTWKKVRDLRAGYDVYLPLALQPSRREARP